MGRLLLTAFRATSTDPVTLRIGHTPDMDDAFMFYGIATGTIPMDGLRVEHIVEDIQTLNRRALNAELDVTAISAAIYPAISKHYWILSVGSSVGQGYGPIVIATTPLSVDQLAGRRVAVPGLETTACLLLRLAAPEITLVPMPFEQIPAAVQRRTVDAGVLIHEGQLTYRDAGLVPVLELGQWWQQRTKLPLPLGLNVVKKTLRRHLARRTARLLHESIVHGFANQEAALAYAMRYGRGTDAARALRFVKMYVNEDSLMFSKHCREALRVLFEQAFTAGLMPHVPRLSIIEPAKDR